MPVSLTLIANVEGPQIELSTIPKVLDGGAFT